ncbi:MAG TPA: heme-binding protein [Planctomycetota bacterium]|nr:heme-binding protein [Planctomycetota bacterium]
MSVEEARYQVVSKSNGFEVRDYAPYVVAETVVDAPFEDAGNRAFQKLFRYISGANRSRTKIAMTAPVSQESAHEKIEMTAPVGQRRAEEGWAVSFAMPASYTMETLPLPEDSSVKLRQVEACRMAAVRYSGVWSEKHYLRHKQEMEAWIEKNGFRILGQPIWARYNPPFTLWFLRRNEVLIPVDTAGGKEASSRTVTRTHPKTPWGRDARD